MSDIPISNLPRTRSLTINRLKELHIETYADLLNYFPFRYEDYSQIKSIAHLVLGDKATIRGEIVSAKNHYTKRGLQMQKVKIKDSSGSIEVNWFNQSYILRILTVSKKISVSGTVIFIGNSLAFQPYEYELLSDLNSNLITTGKIIPVYSEKQSLSAKLLRDKISYVLSAIPQFPEIVPNEISAYNSLVSPKEAYTNIHFPESEEMYKTAKNRLSFEELFCLTLLLAKLKKESKLVEVKYPIHLNNDNNTKIMKFINDLPFILTGDQNIAVKEILTDLQKPNPMNRFLQGDVGSGKTIVAAIASYAVYLNGCKTIIMAPTEILAKQHFETFSRIFKETNIKIGLITGSQKINEKDTDSIILIGTHALLNHSSIYKKVGLIIIDEQHRFGVKQRAYLKSTHNYPHLLTMTATPIPRTIALTLYGDLDISVLIDMPKGRLPIKSFLVPNIKRQQAYEWIRKKVVSDKQQIFIVCPRIDESQEENLTSIKAVKIEFETIQKKIFPELQIGLLHGKLKPGEKDDVMNKFKDKKIDILVSTSVVEVGIDIPNATIMVIEGSDNFGLAQLHQLRGRVGRSNIQSYCLLFTESEDPKTVERLAFFAHHTNGFELSEYDYKRRGSGNIFGIEQHGYLKLKIATLSDTNLITQVKKSVTYFMTKYPNLTMFPQLEKEIEKYNIENISMD